MSLTAAVATLVTHLAAQLVTPPWCEELQTRLEATEPTERAHSYEAYALAVAHVPAAAAPVVEFAQLAIEESGQVAAGLAVLRELVRHGCGSPLIEDATLLREKVRSLEEQDPRFKGTRDGPDLIERLLDRASAFLMELLESPFMQRYAGVSRVVYLVGLALIVSFWSLRLYRARRTRHQSRDPRELVGVVSRTTVPDAQRLLEEAYGALREGQLRRCLRAVYLALLVDAATRNLGTFPAAATDRELLSRLPSSVQRRLEPLTLRLQASLYGRTTLALVEVEGLMRDATGVLSQRQEHS